MRLIEVNLASQRVREVKLSESPVKRYCIPNLAVWRLVKLGLANPGDVLLVRSGISSFDVPSRSIAFICRVDEDRIECTPLFSKNIGSMMATTGTDFIKICEEGSATLVLDKPDLTGGPAVPQLVVRNNRAITEIAIHYLDIDTKVELELVTERLSTEGQQDTLTARRLKLLMSLSPITGKGRPVHREGILALLKRLVGLELSQKARSIIESYLSEKLGCLRCETCCLNVDIRSKLHSEIPSQALIEQILDDDVKSALQRIDLDGYFVVLALYMKRFGYPEPIENVHNFLERLSLLYKITRLMGLCPLYTLHFSKSRKFEFDLARDVFAQITGKLLSGYALRKLVETIKSRGSTLMLRLDRCEALAKMIDEAPEATSEPRPVLEKLETPAIQAALDIIDDLERVCQIASVCAKCGIDIVEVGTPLLKKYGIYAITSLKQSLAMTKSLLLADTKTMDVGDLEARVCYLAGADIVTVMGVGTLEKISESLYEAVKFNKAVLVDLMQVPDPLRLIEELRDLLESCREWIIICLHRGITEQLLGRGIASDVDLIRSVKNMLPRDVKLAVAGGVKLGEVRRLVEAGADIVIVGAALYTSRDIEGTAKALVKEAKGS